MPEGRPRSVRSAQVAVSAAAVCFGTTFVVVQRSLSDVGPVPFIAVRFLLAAGVMAPFAWRRPSSQGLWRDGMWCGISLLAGYVLQTVGLRYTSTSVSAFVTYLLVVMVPLLAVVVLHERLRLTTGGGVLVTTAGLGLLTGLGHGFGRGVALTLGSAFAFAVNIILVARAAPRHDPFRLTAVEMLVVGAGTAIPGVFLGGYRFTAVALAGAAFTAVAASALAFSLLVWGQVRLDPTRASLLLMLEPVTATIIGFAQGNGLAPPEVAGAVLILAGIALAELPGARASDGRD